MSHSLPFTFSGLPIWYAASLQRSARLACFGRPWPPACHLLLFHMLLHMRVSRLWCRSKECMRSISFISVVLQGRIYNTGYFDIALAEINSSQNAREIKDLPCSVPHHSQEPSHPLLHVVASQTLLHTWL